MKRIKLPLELAQEVMKKLSEIEYGFPDENGNNILITNETWIHLPHGWRAGGVNSIWRISWFTVKQDEIVFLGMHVVLNVKDAERNNDVENVYSTNRVLKY